MTSCPKVLLATALVVCTVATQAQAAVVTVYEFTGFSGNSVTFDTNNAVRGGTTSGTGYITGSGMTNFRANHLNPVNFDIRPTMVVNNGNTPDFTKGATSAAYHQFQGHLGIRGSLQLGWGMTGPNPNAVPNSPGNDLVVMEWSNCEGYLTRVRTFGGGWSGWRYTPAQWRAVSSQLFTWQTLLDFSDFGVAPGQFVTDVEFQSLLQGDAGTPSGPGFDFNPATPTVGTTFINPQTGNPFAASGVSGFFNETDLTADIWYVASLHDILEVPEPATLIALVAGLALIGRKRS